MTQNLNILGLGLLRQPKMVLFGPGQRRQLPFLLRPIARAVLIVTDARMATAEDFTRVKAGLAEAGLEVIVYDRAEPDLPLSNIIEVVAEWGERLPDVVVGIGGGSCLDLAKVAAVALVHKKDVRSYFGEFNVPGPGLPVVTVPTTGGTGAEVTSIAVVFDREQEMKVGIASPHLEPMIAIVDPELTLSCPPSLTAATGADALSHLVEAFTARSKNPTAEEIDTKLYVGKNRLTDIFAREGLRLMHGALERVVRNPSDIDARADVMLAAYCAGMAINTTGTAGIHAIQSPIAAVSHASHGFGVGALLPYVMRFNLPDRIDAFAEMARIFELGEPGDEPLTLARRAIERVEELLVAIGAPLDLEAIGVKPVHVGKLARQSMLATRLTANNPRSLSTQAVEHILERGIAGDRSWWAWNENPHSLAGEV